jgi:hypothetical protein
MCFWITALVLAAWWYDRNMMMKFSASVNSGARKLAWAAAKAYTSWKTPNEMIKHGYHVMKVFLHEHPKDSSLDTKMQAIDVLGFFREDIVSEEFTHAKSLGLREFIERCYEKCKSEDIAFPQPDPTRRYELVVHYVFDHEDYTIVYDTDDKSPIRFPIYTESAIRHRDRLQTVLEATVTAKREQEDGMNVYDHIKRLAGPMGNFYADSEFCVKKRHLHFTGFRVPLDDAYLRIMDGNATTHIISPKEEIITIHPME